MLVLERGLQLPLGSLIRIPKKTGRQEANPLLRVCRALARGLRWACTRGYQTKKTVWSLRGSESSRVGNDINLNSQQSQS